MQLEIPERKEKQIIKSEKGSKAATKEINHKLTPGEIKSQIEVIAQSLIGIIVGSSGIWSKKLGGRQAAGPCTKAASVNFL
jgi:hypothetical protein